jgi:glycosyltransferase involved in cell wall biosynthesis
MITNNPHHRSSSFVRETSRGSSSSENDRPVLSVVVPVYHGEAFLHNLVARVKTAVEPLGVRLELVLIEDSGPDKSWEMMVELQQLHPELVIAQLSRNFGQHKAITAGLSLAKGDWIVVMDCDLQDQPEEIPKLFDTAMQGWEVVLARRLLRQDSMLKCALSRAFHRVLGYLTGTTQDASIANFGVYSRSVIDAVLAMPDASRCFPIMVRWVGFRTTAIEVEHAPRMHGKSSYSFRSALNLAIDTMLAFSDRPLRLTLKFGLILAFTAFTAAISIALLALFDIFTQAGWASIIVSVWFFSGLIISLLGCVGLYVGKAYEQSKNRPLFVVREMHGGYTLSRE